jgi:hypothetical protein
MMMIDNICQSKSIPYVMWVNNSEEIGQISEETLANQAAALRAALAAIRPFEMMEMEEYERLVEARAKEMMDKDPTNTVKQKLTVPTQKVHTYKEQETYTVPTIKRKYTDAEVTAKARQLAARPENKRQEVVTSTRQVDDFAYDIVNEEHTIKTRNWFLFIPFNGSRTFTTQKVVKRAIKKDVTDYAIRQVERPAEEFEGGLREEMKIEEEERKREIERFRVEQATEEREVTVTRRDAGYYKAKASKEMAREHWKQPR